jgi:hypothetical protein
MSDLIEALQLLDPTNDAHWTQDGAPRIDVLKELTGDQELSRAMIVNAAPEFSRAAAAASAAPPSVVAASETKTETPDVVVEEQEEFSEPKGEIELAREELQAIEQEIAERREDINERSRELQKRVDRQDELIKLLDDTAGSSHMRNQDNIMQFLASQQRQREMRAAQRRVVLQNLDPSSLDPRSKLDQSFSRKNSRGAVPPTRRDQT